ncbi:MAG TPA: hypothetical protein VNN79_16790 [Actinomycetota bacterium]|nr:hypothetical protein [Actinomycetota bacterium]
MAYRGQLTVVEPDGSGMPTVGVSVEVAEDSVTLVPDSGSPITIAYLDLDDVWDEDYTLHLTDFAWVRYDLSMLGKAYGQVLADVRRLRNDVLQHDLLLTGVNLRDTFPSARYFPGGAVEPVVCEIRVFEDLVVVVPERGVMWGVPYSFVEEVRFDEDLYQTHVLVDDGAQHVFGMMGKRSQEFVKELQRNLDSLAARTARSLGYLVPGLQPAVLSKVASRMRDGRAVQQREIDAIAPGVWPRLVDAVMGTADLQSTYDRLTSMSPPGWVALGVKSVLTESPDDNAAGPGTSWEGPDAGTSRVGHLEHARDAQSASRMESAGRSAGMQPGMGAMMAQMQEQMSGAASAAASEAAKAAVAEAMAQAASPHQPAAGGTSPPATDGSEDGSGDENVAGVTEDETGRDRTIMWFFTPLADGGRPLNAVAQEITSEKGHATYVFRLLPPDQFEAARQAGDASLADAVTAGIARLNRALLTLNFRREPIYLTDDQIATGKWARYRAAVRKLDYLQWTRSAFLGRAIHNTTWEQQLLDLAKQA